MRARPPEPPPWRDEDREPQPAPRHAAPHQRCPYLEQILREKALMGMVRYKADCHVDARTHRFTGRHPRPPCITDPPSCALYRRARGEEDLRISRYTD